MRLPVAFYILLSVTMVRAQESEDLKWSTQCLVVLTESWQSTTSNLIRPERSSRSSWNRTGEVAPVVTGKNGLAWGRGVTKVRPSSAPEKREGDDRAPAGIFRLGTAFGYSAKNPGTKMPYFPLTRDILGIDDPASRYYNQLIDQSKIKDPDWQSAEKMILKDDRYKWGVVVQHNVPPKPGSGSCIFLHVWKTPTTLTTGCTAMDERALLEIIRWLDPARAPLLVQMPRPVYRQFHSRWGLPDL